MIDSTHSCAVIFRGELIAGVDTATIKEKLMAAFKLNEPQVDRLLASTGTVLKKDLSTDQASRYQARLRQLGLVCHIVANTEAPATSDKPLNATPPATKIDPQLIERAFDGEFEAVRINRKYLMGLLATATLMTLLPLIYIGIIVLTGYGTLWHIVNNLVPAANFGSGIITGVLYFTPIVVGIALTLFLIKPLFARPARGRRPIVLDPVRHRRFFQFVEHICSAIGAPRPSAIHVDGYVNASARLSHGVLSNQLILTVGMPLIMGLNTRELAGVLAHEFGHFAQRYGMRLGYLIHAINCWLTRVVHERDSWDEQLDQWLGKSEHFYVRIMAHCTRLCIWLTRKLLHGLMLLGILVSRYMSRQMEFDADLYEARLAGSQQFRRTTLALRVLSSAFAEAQRRNIAAWNEGHLTDNLPRLAVNLATTLPPAARQELNHQMRFASSQRWATHPTDAERIEHAGQECCDGIFRLELPAALLLHDHERLNKLTTLNYYQNEGIRTQDAQLVAPEKILETASNRSESQATLERYFNGHFQANRILPLAGAPDQPPADTAQLQTLIDEMRQQGPEAKSLLQQYESMESQLSRLRLAYALLEAGIAIDSRSLNLPSPEKNVVEAALSRTLADYHAGEIKLRRYEKLMGQRLSLAVALACNRSDATTQQQIIVQWRALQALGKLRETLTGLHCYGFVLAELYAHGNSENSKSLQVCSSYVHLCNREIEHAQSVLANYQDPFASNEEGTLAQLIQQWIEERKGNSGNEIESCLATKQAVIDALLYLNGRITGALAIHASLAERAAGIKPMRLV